MTYQYSINRVKSGRINPSMQHLTCFAGGMIALGAQKDPQMSESEMNRQMSVSQLLFIVS